MNLTIRKQTLQLLPEKALFWKDSKMLIIADIHIGKAAVFRHQGIPIPEGSMQDDLVRLQTLVSQWEPSRLLIAGDFIHAKIGMTVKTKQLVAHVLHSLNCPIHLVIGNHDRLLVKNLPGEWPLILHKEPLIEGPFAFCHEPQKIPGQFVISGHIHPQILLSCGIDEMKFPCFVFKPSQAILPAYSSFAGGLLVKRMKGCRLFVPADNEVVEV